MTLSEKQHQVVKEWLAIGNNMNNECRGIERQSLCNQLARLDSSKNTAQINRQLEVLLRVHRNGLIKPEYTKKGVEPGLVGAENSIQGKRLKASYTKFNTINNPINNPINRQRQQDELRAQHELELAKIEYIGEVYFGKEGAKTKVDSIVLAHPIFELILQMQSNYTLHSRIYDKFDDNTISFYIFYTSRDASINGQEWASFLSSRSGYYFDEEGNITNTKARPVLRHNINSPLYRHNSKSDGSIITRNQMIHDLGFKVEILLTSKFKINARDVEDELQSRFQDLPLGCRLWRRPDCGGKFEIPEQNPEIPKVHSVGIAYSYCIVPLIEQGMIEVDGSGGHKKLSVDTMYDERLL